ncbi:unnamed protein product [Rotaria sp. Silwood2]|nr:unnamed protein product [Rotaria sp. Silwood2]
MFVHDNKTNIDCLDRSDESEMKRHSFGRPPRLEYIGISIFRCEERTCRFHHSFSCGDGEYVFNLMLPSFINHCFNYRNKLISHITLTSLDHVSNINCRQILLCLIMLSINTESFCTYIFENFFHDKNCKSLDMDCSSEWITVPEQSIIYGFFQFVYRTNRSMVEWSQSIIPDLICFHAEQCSALLFCGINIDMNTKLTYRAKRCLAIGTEQSCSHSSLFHCSRSMRCISYHRLVDDFQDCYFNEDELYPSCQLNDSYRFICELDHKKCLSPVAISNLLYECSNFEDKLSISELTYKSQPTFSRFCDGFLEMIDTNETDDTSCELWPCDNPYTHCDGNWNCPNGTDELNCSHKMYSSNEYQSTPIHGRFDLYLTTYRLGFFPPISTNTNSHRSIDTLNQDINASTIIYPLPNWYCNRRIPILVASNETTICLCPPTYFGLRCQ